MQTDIEILAAMYNKGIVRHMHNLDHWYRRKYTHLGTAIGYYNITKLWIKVCYTRRHITPSAAAAAK